MNSLNHFIKYIFHRKIYLVNKSTSRFIYKYGYNNKQEISNYLLKFINCDKNYSEYKIILEKILSNINYHDDLKLSLEIFKGNSNLDYGNELIGYIAKHKDEVKNILIDINQENLLILVSTNKLEIYDDIIVTNYGLVLFYIIFKYEYKNSVKLNMYFLKNKFFYTNFLRFIKDIEENKETILDCFF